MNQIFKFQCSSHQWRGKGWGSIYTSSRRKESLLSGAERPLQVRLRCHLPKLDSTPALQLLKRRKPSCQSSRYKQEQTKEHAVWCAQHGMARSSHARHREPDDRMRGSNQTPFPCRQQLLSPPRARIHRDHSGFWISEQQAEDQINNRHCPRSILSCI